MTRLDTKKATVSAVATTSQPTTTNCGDSLSGGLSLNIKSRSSVLTMSSREIAEILDTRHSHVIRSIERLIDRETIKGYAPTGYTHPQNGQTYKEYLLEKRDTYIVVAQLSPEFTAKIVDRWQELENQTKQPLPYEISRKDLALMILQAEEEKERLMLENQQKDLAIESLQSYFKQGQTAPQFVKSLNGVNSCEINKFLQDKKWLYKDLKVNWRVASYARDKYLTEETVEIVIYGREPRISYKPVLLKKGVNRLYEFYLANQLPMKRNWNGEYTLDKAV